MTRAEDPNVENSAYLLPETGVEFRVQDVLDPFPASRAATASSTPLRLSTTTSRILRKIEKNKEKESG
ncbi:unnamed protein product [Linum trigynum]|uniref:Uncharacterized protein n=1 Tax=Linum trigynum TaxID=586398 RepID=A0AAV2FI18_9ROSI